MMATYTRDLIWQKLSVDYGVTVATHSVDDVFEVWQEINGLTDGQDLGAFYTTATGIKNFGDAEYAYWDAYTTGTFTPAAITTQGWWDASDSSTITLTSGKVSQWADKSGNARHATQSTAGNRPVVVLAAQNGKDVISFFDDGTADWLTAGTTSTWKFLHDGTAKNIVAFVWKPFKTDPGTVVYATAFMTCNITSNNTGVHFRYNTGTSVDSLYAYVANNVTTGSAFWPLEVRNRQTAGAVRTTPSLYSIIYDLSAPQAQRANTYINNLYMTGVNTGTGNVATGNSNQALMIGASVSAQTPCKGYIMEIVIVSGADATEANRLRIQGYLNQKWGVY